MNGIKPTKIILGFKQESYIKNHIIVNVSIDRDVIINCSIEVEENNHFPVMEKIDELINIMNVNMKKDEPQYQLMPYIDGKPTCWKDFDSINFIDGQKIVTHKGETIMILSRETSLITREKPKQND